MNPAPFRTTISGFGSDIVRTDRDNEYEAFSRVTHMLHQAQAAEGRQAEILAVDRNNQLWTILANDLALSENRMPDELRAGLLSLAFFSLRHGHRVLIGEAGVDPLIDINQRIMKGLRGDVIL